MILRKYKVLKQFPAGPTQDSIIEIEDDSTPGGGILVYANDKNERKRYSFLEGINLDKWSEYFLEVNRYHY